MGEIDRDVALEIQLRAMRDFLELVARSSESALVIERRGVTGSVVPRCPRRSVPNSVIYRDWAELAARLDDLASVYENAGVDAWTVWAPEFDRDAIAALERAGHHFDGNPAAMVAELDGFEAPPVGDLDWDDEAEIETVARLNNSAYGHSDDDGFGGALHDRPEGIGARFYQARIDGEPACVVVTIDHAAMPGAVGADCGIYFVATDARHRGRGLTTRLLGTALAQARERGCVTSSLQASPMGFPIYERLGYRSYYRWNLYERRRRIRHGSAGYRLAGA